MRPLVHITIVGPTAEVYEFIRESNMTKAILNNARFWILVVAFTTIS
jgi:hypothetical protein